MQDKYQDSMKTKKLKKISKELLKASAMHKSQANRIKAMMQSGGVRSRYDSNLNRFTDARKSLSQIKQAERAKKKYMKKGGYMERMMYQAGGMYGDNTVAAAGQGNMGSTSNIVFQESDPMLQQQRLKGLESEKDKLQQDLSEAAMEADQMEQQEQLDIQEAEQKAAMKQARAESYVTAGIEGGKQLGLLKEGKSAGQSVKDAIGVFKAVRQANKIQKGMKLAAEAQRGIRAGVQTAQQAKAGLEAAKIAKESGSLLMQGSTAATAGTTAANVAGTGSALGSAASALNNANVYAAAANFAGKGIKRLSDDDDATTWTAGEATGDVLSKAGEYAGYGAIVGSAVPVVGNAVGALVGATIGTGVGLVQGFSRRGKARQAEREAKQRKLAFKQKTDAESVKRLGSQLARARSGELRQKTYSGYDLGRNVTAQLGGMRMGIPRYGYAV